MKKITVILLVALLWAATANAANGVIGINFYSGDDNKMVNDTADGLSTWTDAPGITGTGIAFLGSDGAATCTFSTGGNWWAGLNTTSEQRLYHSYLDDGGVGIHVTISGLGAWMGTLGANAYIVRIYHCSDHTAAQGYTWGPDEITDDSATPVVLDTKTLNVADCWTTSADMRGFVDSTELSNDTIKINPFISASGGNVRGCLAGIKITAISGRVKCVAPASGAINVPVSQDLSWQIVGPNVQFVDLYFGTQNDPNLGIPANKKLSMEPATTTSYVLPDLEYDKTYYWRVDAYEPNTLPDGSGYIKYPGLAWKFKTRASTPLIITQPVSTRFKVNDANAKFTIGVESASPASYQWYYSPNNNLIDAADTAIAAGAGGNTSTVTLTSHNKAYQAYYYCKVWNAATISGGGTNPDVYSNVVSLVVERKVAEYLFNGNLTDTSTMAFNGTGVGTPTYVTGVGGSGQALSLNGTSQYVQIGNPADPNTFNKAFPRADLFTNITGGAGTEVGSGGGLDVGSILCWVKMNATDVNDLSPIMFNSNAGWPHTEFLFGVLSDSTAVNTNLRSHIWSNSGNSVYWMDIRPAWANPFDMGGDGQWHMLAATWNMNGTVKAYVDGNLLGSWNATPGGTFTAWGSTMKIGFDGTNYFSGAIDNLRVYNYELTAAAIESEAYLVTGKHGCLTPDFTGNIANWDNTGTSYCRLDLADFASIASVWLNNGFYILVP